MKRKLSNAIKKFKLHLEGSTESKKVRGGYNIKRRHECADCWLSDIEEINANAMNNDDGKSCVTMYWLAIIDQISNDDYYAAKLLALKAFPLMRRCDDSISLEEVLIYIDSCARERGKDPYNKRYINMFELVEAAKRFVNRCVDKIVTDISNESQQTMGKGVIKIPDSVSDDMAFVSMLPVVLGVDYRDLAENKMVLTAKGYHVMDDYDREIVTLGILNEHCNALVKNYEKKMFNKELLVQDTSLMTIGWLQLVIQETIDKARVLGMRKVLPE